jgi:hypothetical protein
MHVWVVNNLRSICIGFTIKLVWMWINLASFFTRDLQTQNIWGCQYEWVTNESAIADLLVANSYFCKHISPVLVGLHLQLIRCHIRKNNDIARNLIWESKCLSSPWKFMGTVYSIVTNKWKWTECLPFHPNTVCGTFDHNIMQQINVLASL